MNDWGHTGNQAGIKLPSQAYSNILLCFDKLLELLKIVKVLPTQEFALCSPNRDGVPSECPTGLMTPAACELERWECD